MQESTTYALEKENVDKEKPTWEKTVDILVNVASIDNLNSRELWHTTFTECEAGAANGISQCELASISES